MHSSGLSAFHARDKKQEKEYSFEQQKRELSGVYLKEFKKNEKAWKFFQAQPPYYKKVFSFWVMSAKKEETRGSRLAQLIKASAKSIRLDMMSPNRPI
jgi:hypothetical protein